MLKTPDGKAELVAAVSDHAAVELARRMQQQHDGAPTRRTAALTARARFRATGEAYLHFALDEPELFRTLFRAPSDEPDTDERAPLDSQPFMILSAALDQVAATGGMRHRLQPWTDYTAWAAVHGLAVLILDGPLRALPSDARHAAITRLLDTIERGIR